MRKIVKAGICTMTAMMLLAGCSTKDKAAETTTAAAQSGESQETAEATTEAYVAESSVKLGSYKGIKVSVQEASVSPEEIEAKITQDLNSNAEYPEQNRAAENGDTVNIAFTGFVDGKEFEGGSSDAYDLVLGSNSFIDGFEAGLVGAKKGEKKSLDLKFPEDYGNTGLAGKDVTFEVTINTITKEVVPELTDEFVLKVFPEDKNVGDYRKRVEASLLEQKTNMIENQRNNDILDALMTDSEVICGTDDIEKEYQAQLKSVTDEATMYGMDLNGMASMYGTDEAGLKIQLRLMATDYTKQKLLFKAVADAEKISVAEEDLDKLAKDSGFADKAALIEQYGEGEVQDVALSIKVMDYLVANAEITAADAEAAPESGVAAESSTAQ